MLQKQRDTLVCGELILAAVAAAWNRAPLPMPKADIPDNAIFTSTIYCITPFTNLFVLTDYPSLPFTDVLYFQMRGDLICHVRCGRGC